MHEQQLIIYERQQCNRLSTYDRQESLQKLRRLRISILTLEDTLQRRPHLFVSTMDDASCLVFHRPRRRRRRRDWPRRGASSLATPSRRASVGSKTAASTHIRSRRPRPTRTRLPRTRGPRTRRRRPPPPRSPPPTRPRAGTEVTLGPGALSTGPLASPSPKGRVLDVPKGPSQGANTRHFAEGHFSAYGHFRTYTIFVFMIPESRFRANMSKSYSCPLGTTH